MKGYMEIIISVPNDAGSEADEQTMLAELGEKSDIGEAAAERLADIARAAGLSLVGATDFGFRWRGSAAQIAACEKALPTWAYHHRG